LYGLVTGFNESSTTNNLLLKLPFSIFLNANLNTCPCVEADYGFVTKTIDRWTVGLALDKSTSPKKCLDFYLSRFDFLNMAIGIQEACKLYYKKDLNELSENEILELCVMTLNPSLYSKYRRQELLTKKVEEYKSMIKREPHGHN